MSYSYVGDQLVSYIFLDELRSKLGLIEDEYKKMGDFKKGFLP
jgi:plasmid replication initiation protein